MKQVLVFRHSHTRKPSIYTINEEATFYESIVEKGMGFSIEKVQQHLKAFSFFDDVASAQAAIADQAAGVVDASRADYHCPQCHRGYEGVFPEEYDDLETSYRKECPCGHKFTINRVVSFSFTVS